MTLIDKNKQKIKQLCLKHKVQKLSAFGSVLTDQFTSTSDVDMLVTFDTKNLPYMIPDVTFTPEISVNYDVVFTNESGTEVITRKNITSSVLLNKVNFSNLVNGEPGVINPIRILIQPRYLYVIADEDAYTGRLLIE